MFLGAYNLEAIVFPLHECFQNFFMRRMLGCKIELSLEKSRTLFLCKGRQTIFSFFPYNTRKGLTMMVDGLSLFLSKTHAFFPYYFD